jgi:hypothetical protein
MLLAASSSRPAPDVEPEEQESGGGLPWTVYPFAPFVVIPAVVLGLWQLPTIAFAALTIRRAVKIESKFWGLLYSIFLALLFVASFAWPFVVIYLLPL